MKYVLIFLLASIISRSSFSQDTIVQYVDKNRLPILSAESSAFSQLFTISDMKELCDTASPEEYLYAKGVWDLAKVCQFPFLPGYERKIWYFRDLDLSITTYGDGRRVIMISTLSKEYYDDIRESLPINNMKKRLVGYSDGEFAMQIYSLASDYGPGFNYSIIMERRY